MWDLLNRTQQKYDSANPFNYPANILMDLNKSRQLRLLCGTWAWGQWFIRQVLTNYVELAFLLISAFRIISKYCFHLVVFGSRLTSRTTLLSECCLPRRNHTPRSVPSAWWLLLQAFTNRRHSSLTSRSEASFRLLGDFQLFRVEIR